MLGHTYTIVLKLLNPFYERNNNKSNKCINNVMHVGKQNNTPNKLHSPAFTKKIPSGNNPQ